ncbi:SWIM zinc finger domain-containing protein [Candidatus Parvarchaeota archaeon]|nr:SWIM zinc finger domain-containing protein [Candidatus Parvarchaeota archaeon]
MELIPQSALEKDGRKYVKGVKLAKTVRLDYKTEKHASFIVEGEESVHNVMYFEEKQDGMKWQCDCKWYTLQNKTCSHIIAVNIALNNGLVPGQGKERSSDIK